MRKNIINKDILESDLVAIADDKGNQITYKKLIENLEIISKEIEERSLIFVLCDYRIETLEFIYKLLYLNRVPLLLSRDINQELFDNLLEIYRPRYIFFEKDEKNVEGEEIKINLSDHVLMKTNFEKNLLHPDLALLLSTSGTTGGSKLVKLSYSNLYYAGKSACEHMNIQSGQRGLCPSPLNHVLGIIFCIWHWHCGATILITDQFVISNRFKDFYTKMKVDNFAATPYVYGMLNKIQFWDLQKINNLNWAISAGEKMPEKEQEILVSIMKEKFWNAYGQTESAGFISVVNHYKNNGKKDSVGQAFKDIETRVEEATNELVIIGKNVCMGYADHARQLEEGDINHGILHTGDVVSIDEEGFIFLQGRLGRYVKILGKRVNLSDLEKYLRNKFPSIEVACIGADNDISVFYSICDADLGREIQVLLDQNMKIPSKYVNCIKLEILPRNDTGKIAYTKLNEINPEQ